MKSWSLLFPVGPESVVVHPPLDLIVTTDNLYVYEFLYAIGSWWTMSDVGLNTGRTDSTSRV